MTCRFIARRPQKFRDPTINLARFEDGVPVSKRVVRGDATVSCAGYHEQNLCFGPREISAQ